MSYEQYWYGDPSLVIAYRDAHKLRIEQANQQLWLQGLYIYNAMAVIVSNVFAKKGATPQKYIDKPLDLFPKEKTKEEIVEQRNKVIQALSNFQRYWNKANADKKE